jgi:hypothetical protein
MTNTPNKPTTVFWIIGITALIWNLMGVYAYLTQAYMTDEALAALPEAQRALYDNLPAWVTAAFAIAVFGGALGCILLLLRKKLATSILAVSLIAILVQMTYNLFMSKASEVYGPGGMIMPVMVIVIGLFLVWYSKSVDTKGWLS